MQIAVLIGEFKIGEFVADVEVWVHFHFGFSVDGGAIRQFTAAQWFMEQVNVTRTKETWEEENWVLMGCYGWVRIRAFSPSCAVRIAMFLTESYCGKSPVTSSL